MKADDLGNNHSYNKSIKNTFHDKHTKVHWFHEKKASTRAKKRDQEKKI